MGKSPLDLSESGLLAAARAETGLRRFGSEHFLQGLRILLRSLDEEAELNAFGRLNARKRILRPLKNRLWANECYERNPEIKDIPIRMPIIIIGPHRSGTTRLQRMLALDSRLQHLKSWEGHNPAPRLGSRDKGRGERHREVEKFLAIGKRMYPDVFTAHPMNADWAEEENLLLNLSFCGFSPIGLFNIPSYFRWFMQSDKTASYQDMANLMRLISWSRESTQKRWILKNPNHLLELPTLMRTFPDARIIFTHRDPIKTVGSIMSLMWHTSVQHSDLPSRARVRDVWGTYSEEAARRFVRDRKEIPAHQMIDVQYSDMNQNWKKSIRRIYEFLEIDLTPNVERDMESWLHESDVKGTHGRHHYSLEDFGTSEDEVDDMMSFVRREFAIPRE